MDFTELDQAWGGSRSIRTDLISTLSPPLISFGLIWNNKIYEESIFKMQNAKTGILGSTYKVFSYL